MDRLAHALVLARRARVALMRGPWFAVSGGFPCRHSRTAHSKRRSMNNGTNIGPLSGMHSCSDAFSSAPEYNPDKIAGQMLFSGRIRVPLFIGESGS